MLRACQRSLSRRTVTYPSKSALCGPLTVMKLKPDHAPDIRLCLDVSLSRVQYSKRLNAISWVLLHLQHFKPSEEDARARAELLDQLTEILYERFGSGFDVEYVGIERYATDVRQAPFEVAIVVCIGLSSLVRG